MNTVLFACTHNAGRSQMAAAFFALIADPARAQAVSAGTTPGPRVHPVVAEAMREVGVELSGVTPRLLTDDLARTANRLVTMGCGEACPYIPGLEIEDWALEDPKDLPLDRVRGIRDDIRARVEELVSRHGWGRTPAEELPR